MTNVLSGRKSQIIQNKRLRYTRAELGRIVICFVVDSNTKASFFGHANIFIDTEICAQTRVFLSYICISE